jgi:23S rRNA (uracil1939-C5)-methyltransferase
VYGGEGLARLDGRVVLAPFVLPGERIRAAVEQEKPRLVRAGAVSVLEPSPDRVPAECPYFTRCGGCHYQHARYESQLAAKRAILEEELRRLGKIEPPAQIEVAAADPYGYRNRVQLQVRDGRIGYLEGRSHRLCPIERCPISSPRINEAIGALNRMVRDPRWPRFLRSLELFTDERQMQFNVTESDRPIARRFFDWAGEMIPGIVDGALDYEGRFRVSRNSFFQVNRFLIDRLVELAVEGEAGETAADLYAGVGLFAVALGRSFREVTAVESGSGAVRDLEFNAQRAGLANLRAEKKSTEEYLASIDRPPDFLLMDPPRSGLGSAVVARLAELRPPRMTIVACDPATLARDLAGLVGAGYTIDRMVMIDLFPQTFHLETVVRMSLK